MISRSSDQSVSKSDDPDSIAKVPVVTATTGCRPLYPHDPRVVTERRYLALELFASGQLLSSVLENFPHASGVDREGSVVDEVVGESHRHTICLEVPRQVERRNWRRRLLTSGPSPDAASRRRLSAGRSQRHEGPTCAPSPGEGLASRRSTTRAGHWPSHSERNARRSVPGVSDAATLPPPAWPLRSQPRQEDPRAGRP